MRGLARIAGGLLAASLLPVSGGAYASGTLYDMSTFLAQPHPFATAAASMPAPQPQLRPQPMPMSAPVRTSAPATTSAPAASSGSGKWISELRGGILKHSISPIGHDAKETGVDGNLEVLFASPGWLSWLLKPRPQIGASFNGSNNNTDVLYAGLQWEWTFWKSFFFDFSFGGAVHNGELSYDASVVFPEYANRRRELGCRALFRESFELGWRFWERHNLSVMWSHYSHGGICGDQNEGLDNLGMRYGYRF
jgi:lipid A 3-O-deacylase